MIFLGAEVQFKSRPDVYWLEKKGNKNHTERMITLEEEEWLNRHKIEQIRISNTSNPSTEFFIETITNIYKEGTILGHSLYSFTWKHEIDEVQKCIDSKDLTGRTGDLYYPLLAIAKLINLNLYEAVLKYARSDEGDRIELDAWNKLIIQVLVSEKLIGSRSAKDIMPVLEDSLRTEGLLKDSERLYARTVTMRLKKLGFQRENKKTDNKTWFIIDAEKLILKAHEYGIVNTGELKELMRRYGGER